jgi:pantoate--beta-alanine ligase
MGALHAGHAELLKSVRPHCQISVLSIFVNPTQFAPHEDLDRYPKTLENDLKIASEESVDFVFAPSISELYPPGYSTYVEETSLSRTLCGPIRPSHFRGVTTIVLKLFNLIQPQLAVFGLKDAQQFFVLKQMVQDLNLNIEMLGVQTVREYDGLALSSRNVYLTRQERERAPVIYKTLQVARDALLSRQDLRETLNRARSLLIAGGLQVQYFDCVRLPDLGSVQDSMNLPESWMIATACLLGKTRLIDNVFGN